MEYDEDQIIMQHFSFISFTIRTTTGRRLLNLHLIVEKIRLKSVVWRAITALLEELLLQYPSDKRQKNP